MNDFMSVYVQWLAKFGLETLGLNFTQYEVKKESQKKHKTTYKHINKKVKKLSVIMRFQEFTIVFREK